MKITELKNLLDEYLDYWGNIKVQDIDVWVDRESEILYISPITDDYDDN